MRRYKDRSTGLILCARKDDAVARYALEGLPNKGMASEYRTALPGEKELAAEIGRTQVLLERTRTPVRAERYRWAYEHVRIHEEDIRKLLKNSALL